MLNIFIVDDDAVICRGIRAIISKHAEDCKIIGQAYDGKAAYAEIEKNKPDLIITDIKMPVMDGIELIRKVKTFDSNIKIIALSGVEEYKYVREALNNGVLDYLLKPVENTELLKLIDRAKIEIYEKRKKDSELKELNDVAEEGKILIQEKFLKEIISGSIADINKYSNYSNLKSIIESGCYLISVLSIDFTEFDIKQGVFRYENQYIYFLKEYMDKLNESEYFQFIYVILNNKVIFLFSSKNSESDVFVTNILNILLTIHEHLNTKTGESFSFGLSRYFNELEKAMQAFFQAEMALDRRFYDGCNRIISYIPEECVYNEIDEKFISIEINEIINSIDILNKENIKKIADSIFEKLKLKKPEPKRFREVLDHILIKIGNSIEEFQKVLESPENNYNLRLKINKIDELNNLGKFFSETLTRITREIQNIRDQKDIRVIEITKEYIRKNYSRDITLKELAEKVYLNSSYLSDYFKSVTGLNYIDYLTEVRINAAKKLLSGSEERVYEIGLKVGYNDTATFNRAFRRITGISPIEYKKLVK